MTEQVETIIIGGGQSGLSMSYHLTRLGREHLILERGRLVEKWRTERWDSLTLLTPNWLTRLPGYGYGGDDPDGFMLKDEVVQFLEGYAASFNPPLRCETNVETLTQKPEEIGFLLETGATSFEARNVVIATGAFQKPKVLPLSIDLPTDIFHLHSSHYKNPAQLPPGPVLVIGSGSSGCQICEELDESGRQVYLSLGLAQRSPRRYRGKDSSWWRYMTGEFDLTRDAAGPQWSKYGPGGQLTGVRGGHDLDYRRFAADGVVLLGHLQGVEGRRLHFAPDLAQTLALWDESLELMKERVDRYIRDAGVDAPPDDASSPELDPRVANEPIVELDLAERGITSVVWATGFVSNFDWVQAPVLDGTGTPVHYRGVTKCPGLYFLGLRFLYKWRSSFIFGVGDDAEYLAEHID